MLTAGILDNRLIYLVARGAYRVVDDDTAQRDDSHLGCAAADVHDHRAYRLLHGQARADSRSHRLLYRIGFARPGVDGRVVCRPAFDLGNARRYADDHARLGRHDALRVYFADEVLEHRLD